MTYHKITKPYFFLTSLAPTSDLRKGYECLLLKNIN